MASRSGATALCDRPGNVLIPPNPAPVNPTIPISCDCMCGPISDDDPAVISYGARGAQLGFCATTSVDLSGQGVGCFATCPAGQIAFVRALCAPSA